MKIITTTFVGVPVRNLFEERTTTVKRTKYHEDTGHPYEINEKNHRIFFYGKDVTEQDWDELENWAKERNLQSFGHLHDERVWSDAGSYIGIEIGCHNLLCSSFSFTMEDVENAMAAAREGLSKIGYTGELRIVTLSETNSLVGD